MDDHNIMEKTGKNNKVILTNDNIFLNASCMFIEYHDVLKAPGFLLINYLKDNENFKQILDTSGLAGLSGEALFEWYANRKTRNPFRSIPFANGAVERFFNNDYTKANAWLDEFLESELKIPEFISMNSDLNFSNTLNILIHSADFVKKFMVYTEEYNEEIKLDIKKKFGDQFKYVYGPFSSLIKDIPEDTTYVFSDIMKVYDLSRAKRLNYASILIADTFGYNYQDGEPKVNFEELYKQFLYKIDFFDNIHYYE